MQSGMKLLQAFDRVEYDHENCSSVHGSPRLRVWSGFNPLEFIISLGLYPSLSSEPASVSKIIWGDLWP